MIINKKRVAYSIVKIILIIIKIIYDYALKLY